jgi:hypothetical protein
MSTIICSTSTVSVGCTFVDWSINYLSGRSTFLSWRHGWIDVVDNPLRDKNAHGHLKNHPKGFAQTQQYVEFFEQRTDYFSLYPCPLGPSVASKGLGLDPADPDSMNQIRLCQETDYNLLLEYLHSKNAKIVLVEPPNDMPLYFLTSRSGGIPFNEKQTGSQEEIREQLDKLFFKNSLKTWDTLGLTNQWDIRERLALDTRPLEHKNFDVVVPPGIHRVSSQDLWHNGPRVLIDILNYCNLHLDQERFSSWINFYTKWQKIQLDLLWFQYAYQNIVESIVTGQDLPIDLTFEQEVVIQHCLIYQHNLNLKTWQLYKFPSNTLDLHKLLEPNIHSVAKIY